MRLTTKTLTITPPVKNETGRRDSRLATHLTGGRHSPVRPAVRQVVHSKTGDAGSLQRCVVLRTWVPEKNSLGNHGHSCMDITHHQRLVINPLDGTRKKQKAATLIDLTPAKDFSLFDYVRSNKPASGAQCYQQVKMEMLPTRTQMLLAKNIFQATALQKRYGNRWGLSANHKVYLPLWGSTRNMACPSAPDRFFLFGLDEAAMSQAWHKRIANPRARYRLISTRNNCAGAVLEVLKEGGCAQWLAPPKAWFYHDPRSVHRYAVALHEKIQQLNERADALMQAAPAAAETPREERALGLVNRSLGQCRHSLDYSAVAAKVLELHDGGWMGSKEAGIALRCIRTAMQNHETEMKAVQGHVPWSSE